MRFEVKLLRSKNLLKASRRLYSTCKKSAKDSKDNKKFEDLRVCKDDSKRFMKECLIAAKASEKNADAHAQLLITADLRGHYSHGMNRLEMYLNELEAGLCDGKAKPKILKETAATAWVDGCDGLGAVTGNFCMQLAIKKAKKVGVGYVVSKGGCHFGIAGYYTMQAIEKEVLGYCSSNTSPLMAPTRSKESGLGTNPLSLGMPTACKEDNFVLDMATTTVAVGKIEIARREGKQIPDSWALGPDGKPTTDPNIAFKTALLMPLGGAESTSGYKGYGLACMVEALGSMLSGSNFASKIRKINDKECPSNLGFTFMAVDPKFFAPDFSDRVSEFLCILRSLPPTEKGKKVIIAGDPERAAMAKAKKEGGLYYVKNIIDTCEKLSKKYKVKMIEPFKRKDK